MVVIGGDADGASKTLIGIATDPEQLERTAFLIAVSNMIIDSHIMRVLVTVVGLCVCVCMAHMHCNIR